MVIRIPGPSPLVGTWRITWMEVWARDAIDLCGPGHIQFRKDGTGRLGFIAVKAGLTWRPTLIKGQPGIRFRWRGRSEYDPIHGRGWVVPDKENEIRGHLVIDMGDESDFTARREESIASMRRTWKQPG